MRASLRRALFAAVSIAGIASGVVWEYQATAIPIQVTVDGRSATVHTHEHTVRGLLAEVGLNLAVEDRVNQPISATLSVNQPITVERARPVQIQADGRLIVLRVFANTLRDVLEAAALPAGTRDELELNGQPVSPDTPLTPFTAQLPADGRPHYPWDLALLPVHISLRRAVPFTVSDGGVPFTVYTTATTIGEALRREHLVLYLGDRVQPSLGSRVQSGLHVFIERSTPIQIAADGRILKTRVRAKTVGNALTEQGVVVVGNDEVVPALSTPLHDNLAIQVTRVREAVEVEQESIPFDSVYQGDDDLEIDHTRLTPGVLGIYKRRYHVVYRDGQVTQRGLQDEWVDQPPQTQVSAYGRAIVSRQLQTESGIVSYWRKMRIFASSYSASTAGVSPSRSYYGITRLGIPMHHGIVAVDPKVIPLGSRVYVPNYGLGQADDTGSAIIGRRIDLGYNDNDLILWWRWVDVYLLDPPPSRDRIQWVLPNWPRQPGT